MELSSFTFNGVSCEEFGLTYAPDIRDMYIWKPVKSNIHQQTFDGHHGGYFYGATKQPKDIVLRVFFEESKVTEGILAKVENFYRVGKTGRLTFGRRPWIYYNATIIGYDDTNMTNKYNGIITIQMRCYYPFGRSDLFDLDPSYEFYDDVVANSYIATNLSNEVQTEFNGLHSNSSLILLNPGNETADVALYIAGNAGANGITVTNETTGQVCRIVGMSKAETTDLSKDFVCDSLNGFCYLTDGTNTEMKPAWHDRGFIQLAPAELIIGGVSGHSFGPQVVWVDDVPPDVDIEGSYIIMDDNRIYSHVGRLDNGRIWISTFESPLTRIDYTNLRFVKGNRIRVRSSIDAITHIKFAYSPTFM